MNTLRLSRQWPDVEVLFEDDSLLALNKPAGLLVAPDRWDKQRENLMGLLATARAGQYIANAHRLDFGTTGVFLLAKTMPALVNLAHQFNERTTRKTYVALSAGQPSHPEFTIDSPIGSHPKQRGLSRIDIKSGKEAKSVVRTVERFRRHTLLHVDLLTGRQHQIRVHLQSAGYPLVGDADYGGVPLLLSAIKRGYKPKDGEEERPLLARPALHAEWLTLKHPVSGEDLTIQATWPRDLEVAVKYLRRYAAA